MINIFKELEVSNNLKELFEHLICRVDKFRINSIEINREESANPENLVNIYKMRQKRKHNFLGYSETIHNLNKLSSNIKLSSIIGGEDDLYFCVWIHSNKIVGLLMREG